MVKINLDNRWFIVLTAALFSSILAFVVLRQLLMNPGIIESIDIQWNQSLGMFQYFFHTWNFYDNGSNIIFISQFPIYGWVLVFRDVALAQRFVYFLTVSLISFNMFLVAFYTLKTNAQKTAHAYLGSIVASLIYTLNPLIFSEVFHISFLWAYSLFPLVFYFGWKSFNSSSRRNVLLSAILLSVFFAFMADAWGMLVGLLILVIVAISAVIMNGRKNLVHRFVPNFLLTLLTMGIVTVSLAAYWLIPYITQRATGPVWDPFSLANLVSNSQQSSLTNIFGIRSWSAQPFYPSTLVSQNQLLGSSFFNVWQFLTLIVPIIAVSAILLRRNKVTLSLCGLLLIGIFLATGVKYSTFYEWLAFYSPRIIPNQAFLLKYPYHFLAIVSLAVALLSSFLVSEVFRRVNFSLPSRRFSVKSHALPTVLFFSIIFLISLVGAPLLTGNLNGALSPVTLPDQYKELNTFFSNQNGPFRVMYVPEEANFNWSANPWANKIEYWGSGVTPLMYGWGISASPDTGFLGDMVYDYLATNQTQYLGKLLDLGNVRFIVFHNDSEASDTTSAYPAFDLYFTEYRTYVNSFLKSFNYTSYFLPNYLNFAVYNSSSISKNLTNSEAYLNNTLNSPAYQDYLNDFSKEYSSFINSTIYNNTHNYLDSSEYLILSGSQYFANSTEYKDFINSAEYKAFLDYYFIYTAIYQNSNDPQDKTDYAYKLFGGSYQHFQESSENMKYQTYLNINNYDSNMLSNLQFQIDLKLVTIPNVDDSRSIFVYENTEMMSYFQAYSKENLMVGGLDALGTLSSIPDFYLNDSAFVFAENQAMSFSQLSSILNSNDIAKNVVFYNNRTIDDLVLDTLDSGVLIAPGDNFVSTYQNGWLKDGVTSYSWTPITLGNYEGVNSSGKYDFGLGHSILYTSNNESLTFSVNVDQPGEHEVWARLLFSPGGGNLSLSIDGNFVGTVNTNTTKIVDTKTTSSSITNTIRMSVTNTTYLTNSSYTINDSNPNKIINSYQSTIPVSYSNVTSDSYITTTPNSFTNTTNVSNTFTTNVTETMTTNYANGNSTIVTNIATTIINETDTTNVNNTISSILDGFNWVPLGNITLSPGKHTITIGNDENGAFNAVNMVALPTVGELENQKQTALDLLNQSNAGIVYVMDNAFLGSLIVGGDLSVPFIATKQSLYNIYFESNQQSNEINVTVDGNELKATVSSSFAEGENWYSTVPINLSQGPHNIKFDKTNVDKVIISSTTQAKDSIESLNDIFGNGAQPDVIGYEKTGPVSFSIKVNVSQPFILSFNEAYDDMWQSNISAEKLIVNSVGNGFLVNESFGVPNNELETIVITYSPEKSFQLGTLITAISLVSVIAMISAIIAFPRIKKKWMSQPSRSNFR